MTHAIDLADLTIPPAELLPRAEAGEGRAQFELGRGLWRGSISPASPDRTRCHMGIAWMEKAAEQNVPEACKLLGYIYSCSGEGAKRDLEKSGRLYLKAYQLGDPAALTDAFRQANILLTDPDREAFAAGLLGPRAQTPPQPA